MNRKFEKLSLAEVGIVAFMVLVLLISLVASWYKGTQTKTETSVARQELVSEDPAYKAAEDAVIALEGNPSKEKLEVAQAAVDKLKSAIKKQELQTRIDKVKVAADNLTDAQTKARLQAELIRAEAAKKLEAERNGSSASSTNREVTEEVVTATSTVSEEEATYQEEIAYQAETTYQAETNTYIAPAQNAYSGSNATTTYTPPASQADPSPTPVSEVSEAPVVETPVTEASTATETSTESPVTSETPATSSTDNP